MILASMFGIYGIFLGSLFLIIKLSSMHSFHKPYLTPFSPLILNDQKDAFIRINNVKKTKYRNPLLAQKNKVRGRSINEKN